MWRFLLAVAAMTALVMKLAAIPALAQDDGVEISGILPPAAALAGAMGLSLPPAPPPRPVPARPVRPHRVGAARGGAARELPFLPLRPAGVQGFAHAQPAAMPPMPPAVTMP